jgi:uncharacterized protein (TIGR01244 family)
MLAMRCAPALALALLLAVPAHGEPKKDTVEGVRNFTVVDATVGCAGATELRAIPALKARGYRAIVNLRQATEPGAAVEESRAVAEAAGLTFLHLPFDGAKPDAAVVDAFLEAVTDPAHQPVFVNCSSGNRVGALWLAKRLVVDGWDEAKAVQEAKAIGLTSEALQKFVLDYATARGRG